jgi:hypothetical protein
MVQILFPESNTVQTPQTGDYTVLDLYITFNLDYNIDSLHFISNEEYHYPFLLEVSNGWV